MTVLTIPVMGPDGQPAKNPQILAQLTDFTGIPVFAGTQNSVPTEMFVSTSNSQIGVLQISLPGNDTIDCGGSANTTWTLSAYWAPGKLSWSHKYYITGSTWNFITATPIAVSPTGNLIALAPPPAALMLNSPDDQTLVVAPGKELDLQGNVLINGTSPVPETLTINGKPLSAPVTLAAVDVGLGQVDNTPDASKPISAAQQAALDGKQASGDYALAESLAPVATSGSYEDLTGKPTLGTAAAQPIETFDAAGSASAAAAAVQANLAAEIARAQAAEALKANTSSLGTVASHAVTEFDAAGAAAAEGTRAQEAETTLAASVSAETSRAEAAEATKADKSSLAPVATSGDYGDLTNKPTIPNTPAQVGLPNVTNDAQVKRTEMGAGGGVATLDSTAHVPMSQIPASLAGALVYAGLWNAVTNTPTLANGSGYQGTCYKVSAAGSTTIDGNTDWHVGDWIIFDGAQWDKLDNYEAVSTVAGKVGAVVLTEADIANLTSDLASKANITSLAPVATSGAYSDLSGKPTIPVVGTAAAQPIEAFDAAGSAAAVQTNLTSEVARAEAAETLKANISSLAPVATSGNYSDLLNPPVIPAAPVVGNTPGTVAAGNDPRFQNAYVFAVTLG